MTSPAHNSTQSGSVAFPQGFLWGVATASYQIEGAAAEDGRKPSIWDTFSHAGRSMHGDTGDVACDHYHRYRDDVALMKDLGLDVYRFSLAWPRLVPDGRGPLNPQGLDFYKRLLDELEGAGVTPYVTLYHWDLPQSLEDAGGWPVRDTAAAYVEYCEKVYGALHDRIKYWTTFNEPWCTAFLGYAGAQHAPGRTDPGDAFRATHHLLLGHGDAIAAMRAIDDSNEFSITLNLYAVDPATDSDNDRRQAQLVDGQHNRLWLDPVLLGTYPEDMLEQAREFCGDTSFIHDGDLQRIHQPLDGLGVNYYMRHTVGTDGDRPPRMAAYPGITGAFQDIGQPKTAMGWQIDADGLRDCLVRVHEDYPPVPLYVTENGAAFHDYPTPDGAVHDPERIAYLDGHFRAAAEAIEAGVDLRGYFVWSLMDNFEWAWGFSRRFGLVWVDYASQERIIKDSGHWFRGVIARNGLE